MLTDDPRIKAAAFVAETFGMDPITVLAADRMTWRIRLAAALSRTTTTDDPTGPEPTKG